MDINDNGIYNSYNDSLINFSDKYECNSFNGKSLSTYSSTAGESTKIREIKGPMVIRGDLLVYGDIIGKQDLYTNIYAEHTIMDLKSRLSNQESEIFKLNTIIQLLCEKFSINLNSINNEFKALKNRTDIDKRLDAI